MHLMYTLDDNGNRVYTLKVRYGSSPRCGLGAERVAQKITDSGKITKSAHPGTLFAFCIAL